MRNGREEVEESAAKSNDAVSAAAAAAAPPLVRFSYFCLGTSGENIPADCIRGFSFLFFASSMSVCACGRLPVVQRDMVLKIS